MPTVVCSGCKARLPIPGLAKSVRCSRCKAVTAIDDVPEVDPVRRGPASDTAWLAWFFRSTIQVVLMLGGILLVVVVVARIAINAK